MKLGLVCISEILKKDHKLAYKTMTRKQFNSKPRAEAIAILSQRILHNSSLVLRVLQHCSNNGIRHYRVSSSMFPLVTDETLKLTYDDLPDMTRIKSNLAAAGNFAREHNISLSAHPDQFNVLASHSETTAARTIGELNHQSRVLDMMGCSQDYSTPMCLHLNLSFNAERETIADYIARFIVNFNACDTGVRNRLVLENEDKGYWNAHNLYQYFSPVAPLVFDNLHDRCNPSPFCYFEKFRDTWKGHTPVMHWSEGMQQKPRSHCDYFTHIPEIVSKNADCVWECEVKAKDYAILRVLREIQ